MAEKKEGKTCARMKQGRGRGSPADGKTRSGNNDPTMAGYKALLGSQNEKRSIENSLLVSIIIFGMALFVTFPTIAQKLQGLEQEDDFIEIQPWTAVPKLPDEQQPTREVRREISLRDFAPFPEFDRPSGHEVIVEDISDLNMDVRDAMTGEMDWGLEGIEAPGPILVAGDITPPEFIERGEKPYPQKARILRRTGTVRIEVVISKAGTLEAIEVLAEEPPDFDFGAAAVTYLRQCEWKPALQNGKPIYARYRFTFVFKLN